MSELFERLNPSQLTAVLCSFAGAVTLVVFILSVLHYQLRALSDQTALERERQNADIAMQKERRARIRTRHPIGTGNGAAPNRSVTGELVGAGDDEVTVASGGGVVAIPYADIKRSNLVGG